MSVLTPEIIRQVALLARLRLSPEDATRLMSQLEQILQHVQRLNTVPTDGVEPTSHVLPLRNVTRADTPQPCLSQEEFKAISPKVMYSYIGNVGIKLKPEAEVVFIQVPKVIEV